MEKNLNVLILTVILILSVILYKLPDIYRYKIPSYIPRKFKAFDIDKKREVDIIDLTFNGIPAKIHQINNTGFVSKIMYTTILDNLENNIEFEYNFYDNYACRKLIADNFIDEVLYTFDLLDQGCVRNDLCKFCILYTYGGIYIDPIYSIKSKLIDYIIKNPLVFTTNKSKNLVSTCVIMAPPGLDIFRIMIEKIVLLVKKKKVIDSKKLLTKLIKQKGYTDYISLYSDDNIYDLNTNNKIFEPYFLYQIDKLFI